MPNEPLPRRNGGDVMQLTTHAQMRMQQGAVRDLDLDLFLKFGTEFDDGLILRNKDVAEATSSMREAIRRLEKLCGKAIILKGDTVLTTYVPSNRRLKKFLRNRA